MASGEIFRDRVRMGKSSIEFTSYLSSEYLIGSIQQELGMK
jgi:hypothetical protein